MKARILENKAEIIIFISSLFVYVYTSSRSIVQGDSGDFLSAAAMHGVPHDSGYPLFTFLAYLVHLIPFNNPAWLINCLSALFAAMSLAVVFRILKLMTSSFPSALFGVIALGTNTTFWYYAEVAQIHTLQVLIFSLVTYFLLLAINSRQYKYLYLASLAFGLGVSNNHTIIFSLPALIATLIYLRRELTLRRLAITAFFLVLGSATYIYIFVAASTNPPINWGGIHDLQSFLFFFFRGDFGVFSHSKPEAGAPFMYSSFIDYFALLFRSGWYFVILSTVSLIYIVKKDLKYFQILFTWMLTGPIFFLLLTLPVRTVVHQANTQQFLAYSYLYLSVFSGMGFNFLVSRFRIKPAYSILLIIAFFAVIFIRNLDRVRLDNNRLTETTTKFELSELPQNAVLVTSYDSLYLPAMYWQYMENFRKDVVIINTSLLAASWYRNTLIHYHPELSPILTSTHFDYERLCDTYAESDRLYLYPWYQEFDSVFNTKCKVIPWGLVNKVVPSTQNVNIDELSSFNDKTWSSFQSQENLQKYKDKSVRTRETLYYLAEQLNYIGIFDLQQGRKDLAFNEFKFATQVSNDEVNSIIAESALMTETKMYFDAIYVLEEGVARSPSTEQLYKNLGVIYELTGNRLLAYENYTKYLTFSPNDPETGKIKSFINDYEFKGF